MADWEQKVEELNKLHRELQGKPQEEKKGFVLSVGGILNAYREGDLSFEDARNLLKVDPVTIEAFGEAEYAG